VHERNLPKFSVAWNILRFIPKNHLSYLFGVLAAVCRPTFFARWLLENFVRQYSVDLESATRPLDEYRSLAELFIRDLKPGLRPIGEGLVSPVDGTLRNCGQIKDGQLLQIKGKTYSIAQLLQHDEFAARLSAGTYFNLYLSPPDYHHIHVPVSGEIVASSYIPGKLWPVNDWSVNSIDGLFTVNERVITYINAECGLVAVVMVGATNVGKITVEYDDYCSNTLPALLPGAGSGIIQRRYQIPKSVKRGERLGTFHLGSTVVLLCESAELSLGSNSSLQAPKTISYGSTLGSW